MNGYIEDLRKILTEVQVTVNEALLEQHSHDESYHSQHLPDMVIYPRDTAEVSAVVRYANEHEIPV
ncbi:2-hydroxy-acid oxidase, partial [Bacillus sp. SIMBA_069]